MRQAAIQLTIEDIKKNNSLYRTFLQLDIDDGWTFQDKIENFELLTRISQLSNHPLSGSSILDVGCGTGDLYEYLLQFENIDYTGVDIFAEGIKKAQLKFPTAKFIELDFLRMPETKYDFIFSSGALTTKLQSDNYQVFFHWIQKMWRMANFGVGFNLLLERYPGDYSANLFVYNKARVLELTAQAASKARMQITLTDSGSGDGTKELHVYLY